MGRLAFTRWFSILSGIVILLFTIVPISMYVIGSAGIAFGIVLPVVALIHGAFIIAEFKFMYKMYEVESLDQGLTGLGITVFHVIVFASMLIGRSCTGESGPWESCYEPTNLSKGLMIASLAIWAVSHLILWLLYFSSSEEQS